MHVKYYLYTILTLMLFGVPAVSSRFGNQVNEISQIFSETTDQVASVLTALISHNPKSVADLKSDYNQPIVTVSSINAATVQPKVRILIVPGHEPNYGGAEFGSLKEREMTVELGQDLLTFLNANSHYQTFVTRDDSAWMPTFADYFKNDWNDILAWEKASIQDMAHRISIGESTPPVSTVYHNSAPANVATRLYGITKWANENNIDITIHIHFNDDTVHPAGVPGTHSGFAIYIPEHQYANSTSSKALAESVFKRLSRYSPVSDLPGESSGVVEDPDLIAVGAHDTADAASMLIEYGYIYESQFADPDTRSLALKDLAFQTYLGLQDFFDPSNVVPAGLSYDTIALPHSWSQPFSGKDSSNSPNIDTFALQTAMLFDGEYPPSSKDMNQCPRSGKFGLCTKQALQAFQDKYSITGEKDSVGLKTLQVLNTNFGARTI